MCRELYGMGFHGWEAAFKHYMHKRIGEIQYDTIKAIIKYNVKGSVFICNPRDTVCCILNLVYDIIFYILY